MDQTGHLTSFQFNIFTYIHRNGNVTKWCQRQRQWQAPHFLAICVRLILVSLYKCGISVSAKALLYCFVQCKERCFRAGACASLSRRSFRFAPFFAHHTNERAALQTSEPVATCPYRNQFVYISSTEPASRNVAIL